MDITNKLYTDTHEIEVSGTTPTGGYLNYENSILTSGCLTMDEYKVTIENGEVTTAEVGSCDSISLTACNSSNFNPSPESWFNFDSTTGTITGFSDAWDGTTDITIPCQINGVDVVNIGNSAFASKGLTSVVISNKVLNLDKWSFVANSMLSKLILGDNVEIIGEEAFNMCNLTNVTIPNNVKTIGPSAFILNRNLTTVNFGSGVEVIEQAAFNSCNIKELKLPNSITTIGQSAFGSNQLEKVTIGENVSIIGPTAFSKNSNSNPNLIGIYNNSGNSFDWGLIINGSSGYNFEAGTVVNSIGNVEITKPN